jgi:two-component system phosphate regulon sensor histidine kinase PhoR
MAGKSSGLPERRSAARMRARLLGARWVLAAAAASLATLALAGQASPSGAIAAFVVIVGVAALAPRRRTADRAGDRPVEADIVRLDGLDAAELAAGLPDPLILFDGHGSVLVCNQPAVTAFGAVPAGVLVQLRFRAPEMQALIEALLEGRRPEAIEFFERVPIERAFRVYALALGGQGGVFALLFKDQSEVRRIDRMRADFIANASHELRTPLASVAGFIETLRGPARNDEKAREQFLQIMQTQTSRMARLIDDLLSLSRLEMKPLLRTGERLDVGALVSEVVESLGHMARERGVVVEVRLPGSPVQIPGSRDELIQVFENLLENALKYGAGGGRVEVTIDPEETGAGREVAVTVRDFGMGIAEEHLPRVTERFYRVDVDTAGPKGTGLGLAIVKHILTRHEGRLSIRSQPGEGAAFTVHLPRA